MEQVDHRDGNDDYRQPGNPFRLMAPTQKDQLLRNTKAAMDGMPVEIVKRHCGEAADSSSEIPSLAGCSGDQLINFGEE
jgi:catalase